MKPSDLVDEIHRYADELSDAELDRLVGAYERLFDTKCTIEGEEIQVQCDNCVAGSVMHESFTYLGHGEYKRNEHWGTCPKCLGKRWR